MKAKGQSKSVYTEEKKSKKSPNKRFTKEIKNPMGTSMGTSFDFSSMMDEQPKKAKKANASRAAKTPSGKKTAKTMDKKKKSAVKNLQEKTNGKKKISALS